MVLIAGPTASGKSQLAVDMARQCNGVVINADSMQVYDGLPLLSAQPDRQDRAGIAHYLYGFVSPDQAFSTGRWLDSVQQLLQDPAIADKTWIFVGGTGLYFRALLGGLAQMPPIDAAIRDKWRQFLLHNGVQALYACLTQKDAGVAARLSANDGQRILRALEVIDMTGRSIADWQKQGGKALVNPSRAKKIVLMPDRAHLAARINERFDTMVAEGALAEVRHLRAMQLDPALPVMKAIGVREFAAYLDGQISLETAIEKAKAETRRYAKRQLTWLRHQLDSSWQTFVSAKEAYPIV